MYKHVLPFLCSVFISLYSPSTPKMEINSRNIFFRLRVLSRKNKEALCYPNQADENWQRGLS